MEITYIAHSCFKIKTKNHTILIDPYNPEKSGYKLPKVSPDILLVTHEHFDHNYIQGVSDAKLLVNGPGEYEIGDSYITGFKTYHDNKKGEERGLNTIYLIEADGFNMLHLGDLGHELDDSVLSEIPEIDILFIPVGGTYTIDGEIAAKVIASIEPLVVIPMHYQTDHVTEISKDLHKVSKFLDEMGLDNVKPIDMYKVAKKSELPPETEIVLLKPTF